MPAKAEAVSWQAGAINRVPRNAGSSANGPVKAPTSVPGLSLIHILYIVGGGSRNTLLNRLTQESTGLEVRCGYVESATIGNFAVQLAAEEEGNPGKAEIAKWAATLGRALET